MKFKVGDKVKLVRIHKKEKESEKFEDYKVNLNKIFTIAKIREDINAKFAILKETSDICPYLSDLELVKETFTKSDLRDGDIVTYRDGQKRTVSGNELINNEECGNLIYHKENLERQDDQRQFDIVKVERPVQYETVFERKEEILDEVEKRYLKNVIRPFKVKSISRHGYYTKSDYFLRVTFEDGREWDLPDFEKDTMYKGMEADRYYTLEELGL